jgi:hypothetical protein
MKDESERQNIKKTDHNKPKFSKKIHNFLTSSTCIASYEMTM